MKHKRALLFYDQVEQILILYGNDETKGIIGYIKAFLRQNFQVEDFENSYIEIDRIHSKRLMWLFVSLIIDYESTKENQNEQLSKLNGLGDSTSQKIRMPENVGVQEKYKSLEVKDIFSVDELTAEDVQFIEQFIEKTNVDLESEANFKFIISTNQMIYLIRKIMQEYNLFLGNGEKINDEKEEYLPPEGN